MIKWTLKIHYGLYIWKCLCVSGKKLKTSDAEKGKTEERYRPLRKDFTDKTIPYWKAIMPLIPLVIH